ncbi:MULTISPECIES: DUF4926 domain-containing protein [unclassified Pseudomonas]|uniref:DUF4926 domain-containing protein n=1 Tax=unclassified Pseudomonas TaxID=196821 RepID=UPI0024492D45|nr:MULTISPECIES: DUF4926 domain-containing protein [unclassified Pseudomonas]MDH0895726.1 DUF4926 domain-containing protein [Pseudomonas sp. GD03875]MDH1066626.1 DUF4926 domain-containing protein [Pseudomonas sp. GD03985]
MPLEINTVVRLLEDMPSEGIFSGSIGVIVFVFSGWEDVYEVEFCDGDGVTVAQIALKLSQLEVVR